MAHYICRPWITTKKGKRINAADYGKDAFCFWVEVEKPRQETENDPKEVVATVSEGD